jgi:SAM-dependent methyltransferase
MAEPTEPIRYRPAVFDVGDPEEARAIILQGETREQVDRRWEVETPWFGDLIRSACGLTATSRVLDFGCGLGRLSKYLIDTTGCRVVGIDISPSMLRLAHDYVGSERFSTALYPDFSADPGQGGSFDAAFACYVLQHVERPDHDLPAIAAALRPGGRFLLVNSLARWVPTTHGWCQDNFDVLGLAGASFRVLRDHPFPPELALLPNLDAETVIRLYERPS